MNIKNKCYVMNRNIYSNIHKSKGGFNGLICNFEKQDSMNNHIASRSTARGDSTILLDPRPLNSNLQTNKTSKITAPFESVKTTNNNGNINYFEDNVNSGPGDWSGYKNSIDIDSSLKYDSKLNQYKLPPSENIYVKNKQNNNTVTNRMIEDTYFGDSLITVDGERCKQMTNIVKPLDNSAESLGYCNRVMMDSNIAQNYPCTNVYRSRPVRQPQLDFSSMNPPPFVIGPTYSTNQCENLWNNLTKSKSSSYYSSLD